MTWQRHSLSKGQFSFTVTRRNGRARLLPSRRVSVQFHRNGACHACFRAASVASDDGLAVVFDLQLTIALSLRQSSGTAVRRTVFRMRPALIRRHFAQEPRIRFGKQQSRRRPATSSLKSCGTSCRRTVRAEFAGKGHFGQRHGQSAFAQVVTRPHAALLNGLVHGRKDLLGLRRVNARDLAATQSADQ